MFLQNKRRNRLLGAPFLTITGLLLLLWSALPGNAAGDNAEPVSLVNGNDYREADGEPYYAKVLQEWVSKGAQAATGTVRVQGAAASDRSDPRNLTESDYEGKQRVLLWQGTDANWVEYRLQVPSDGLYEIEASYRPVTGKGLGNPILWNVTIDGKRPFREASSITLYRAWRDIRPIRVNEDGNEIRPKAEDISSWSVSSLADSGGGYEEPFRWYFTKGEHVLRLEGSEPIALEELRLVPPKELKPYREAAATRPSSEPAPGKGITIQAEAIASKNDTSIKIFSDKDPRTVPVAKGGRIVYNTVGGIRWLTQVQEVAWTFEVPESGNYKLALRALQNQIPDKASFRTIRVDGQIPFREFTAYRIPYSSKWKGIGLNGPDGQPYTVYLEKGSHTLSMAVTHAPVEPIIQELKALSNLLEKVNQDIQSLTGGVVDKNRTWHIEEDLPDLPERLELAVSSLQTLSKNLKAVNGRKDSISQGLDTSSKDIKELLQKPDDLPYYNEQLSSIKEKVYEYIDSLLKQPLQLDEIHVIPAGQPGPRLEAAWWTKVKGTVTNFYYSFRSTDKLSDLDPRLLNVWVQRGRDYVDQLQELADESFTPETGIKVKVNLLPNPQVLLMSNAAGKQPDVALGLTQDLPVDYAIRGSVADLSQFPDFPELYQTLSPGSWLPLAYNKGYYAVPETQSFQVLYYRKDILARLGLRVPETWEELYDLLPALQENGMNFYFDPKNFMPFFYQNNTEFYDANGWQTALDTPTGFKAFQQWTGLFNIYALEREVPSFYQHFRRGTMPIGVSDYNLYVQLAATAPELNGRWGIALIPGTKQPDGTISRWAGGGQRTGVIFEASKKKEQAWRFLKWWVSADVQEQYGADMEAVNGVAFRWNTSNIEAFVRLPWKREDANVILKQWQWYKDIPNVPGGYFLGRELNNAWLRAVVDGMNDRASLEEANIDINRELRRKQQEFGFVDADGNPVRSLDLPVIQNPWEEVNRYVK